MTARWITGLVRARQFQEDHARQQLATAQRLASRAHARVRYNEEHLESLRLAEAEQSAGTFVAAAVALQAAAATCAAAAEVAARADRDTADRRGELSDAAVSRRSAEELAARAEAAERARRQAIEQRTQDEIAASVYRRNHPDDGSRTRSGGDAASGSSAGLNGASPAESPRASAAGADNNVIPADPASDKAIP